MPVTFSCHLAAEYLEEELITALDPTTGAGNNLSKTKRASLCANLKIIIKVLMMAHDLSYASSSKLSPTRYACERKGGSERRWSAAA
jgi:hypothetical protein